MRKVNVRQGDGSRVVVGLSGGVDSAAAALFLHRAGWTVVGVTLHLWDYASSGAGGRCCAPEDQHDARRFCAKLGIPYFVFDRRELFRDAVVEPFVQDYFAGRTPSPCVHCNENVKLGPLLSIARRLGAEQIATGHYARIEVDADELRLCAARDRARDQSYFLYGAPDEALRALVLPLADQTKDEVRAHMAAQGFDIASKPDSTDLCFVEGQPYDAWIEAYAGRAPLGPGPIETSDGARIGTHAGVHRFTVGQRRRIGAVDGEPRFVLRIVRERNAVVVGRDSEARADRVRVTSVRWLAPRPLGTVMARLRYRHAGVRARVCEASENAMTLALDEPQRGIAPGQAAVLYDGDRVVGGGIIE